MKVDKVIATIRRSSGNDSVGDMWNETAIFDQDTPVSEIMQWANDRGHMMLREKPAWTDNNSAIHITLTQAQEPQKATK